MGAGPAGMAAAITARGNGLETLIIDDQPTPGGQIWRAVEAGARNDRILGPSYAEGRAIADAFRSSGADYRQGTQLWQVERGLRALVSRDGKSYAIEPRAIILATGAQERAAPFPGWTLPGVLTVGAAQILLKSAGQIPDGAVWIAGCGPLPLLYAIQLLEAGGEIAGFLDTTPHGQWRSALRYLPGALLGVRDLAKGLGWLRKLRRSGTPVIHAVTDIAALGTDSVEALRYRTADGPVTTVGATTLLVHEGVVPSIHPALSLGCQLEWEDPQSCMRPVVDEWGETSVKGIFIAGDGAGIGGAKAAFLRGQIAGLRVAATLGKVSETDVADAAVPVRRKLRRELASRPFLDAMYRPRREIFSPADDTIICRCEEITAGDVRRAGKVGQPGPNQVKAATRAGMGPCQGRQCGYTVMHLLSEVQNRTPSDVGFLNIRPPLRPLTIGELASLQPARTSASANSVISPADEGEECDG
ncbi:NAD(P)/FAD-dependent oxidoreductase [Sphingobium fuliginis]|uniref:FAD/NAD(P)-dependent oxidoreductase n=1 Tax=Sphingobium fuliginis (strain ATCC 27551) TaxID=336203 RepID=UPI0021003157|nr:NAD(P)/FAD-dependent oxidoreductase [Sphingobium fuliginis]